MRRGDLDADVVVVGAGPVGLAAAIHARAAGLEVLVVDRRTGTFDKACGEGLLPGALRAVQALGADPPGYPLTGIGYRSRGRSADHRFTDGPGRGVPRTMLHAALWSRAADAGATLVHARVTALRQDAGSVEVEVTSGGRASGRGGERAPATLRAGWLLGCDGLHSTTRRLAGLDATGPPAVPAARRRYGLRRHFRIPPWNDLVEVHWSRSSEAYVTPVGPGIVGVALLGSREALRSGAGFDGVGFDAVLRSQFPELRARLAGARSGPVLGAGPLRRRSRRRAAGRVRLVGDASGYVDALTGEGIRVGLAQADAVVRHLDDVVAYERAWQSVTRDYRALTTGLLAWASSPARPAIVPAAARAPWLYGAVVERLAR